MPFDQNDNQPILQPAKRTTRVNLSMVAAMLIFLALGAAGICWMRFGHAQP
jgi:hypothetical protein